MAEPERGQRWFWKWTAIAALVSVVLRVRFLFAPLTADEGGGLAIARAWAHGRRLYIDVWIDRPQGVLLLTRGWDALFAHHPSSLRGLAILSGIAAVCGSAAIARAISGQAVAGLIAAWMVAVVSASPTIEGFTANGELLAAGFSVSALAVAATVLRQRKSFGSRAAGSMLVAGLLAGGAISIKQSGFDPWLAKESWPDEATAQVVER